MDQSPYCGLSSWLFYAKLALYGLVLFILDDKALVLMRFGVGFVVLNG
jgi:hypothetical protein